MFTVSVIIPTYNRLDSLFRAVESVLNQSYKVSEIIIVDDCSDSSPVLFDFEDLSSDIISIYINKEPRGANYSRNFGVSKSKSEIVMFLDDDDTWEVDKVKNQIDIFNRSNDVGLVYSSKVIVNDKDREVELKRVINSQEGDLSTKIYRRNWIGSTSCAAIRREVFDRVGGFDETMLSMQDYDLWIRLCRVTLVGCDQNIGLRYTVFDNLGMQMTGQYQRHERTVERFESKYADIPFCSRMHLMSIIYFNCAKAISRARKLKFLKYAIKSFLYKPNLRVVGLVVFYMFRIKID